MEQAAPFTGEAGAPARDREVLARAPEGHDIDGFEVVRADRADIVVQLGVGEAQSQDGLRVLVDLDRP